MNAVQRHSLLSGQTAKMRNASPLLGHARKGPKTKNSDKALRPPHPYLGHAQKNFFREVFPEMRIVQEANK